MRNDEIADALAELGTLYELDGADRFRVLAYRDELRGLAAVDVVKAYRAMAEELREQELQRAQRALGRGDDPAHILARLARALTNKLMHAPTTGLKQASAAGRQDLLEHGRQLLGLDQYTSGQDTREQTGAAAGQADDAADELELPPSALSPDRHTLQ